MISSSVASRVRCLRTVLVKEAAVGFASTCCISVTPAMLS